MSKLLVRRDSLENLNQDLDELSEKIDFMSGCLLTPVPTGSTPYTTLAEKYIIDAVRLTGEIPPNYYQGKTWETKLKSATPDMAQKLITAQIEYFNIQSAHKKLSQGTLGRVQSE